MLLFLSVIFISLYILPKIYIDLVQISFVKKKLNSSPMILGEQDYKKAGIYAIQKLKFSICSTLYECVLFFCWIGFGFFALQDFVGKFFHNPYNYSLFFLLSFFLIYTLTHIPLSFYLTMVLDKKFGFSKTNFLLFLKDTLQGLLLTLVFSGLIGYVLIYLVSNFEFWWVYGFIFIVLVVLLINVLYPTIIAPIFNKFTPLEDENLKERIEGLLEEVDFKSNGIFVMDASKRDGRLNAYFGGLGKTKRVILFDTLLEKVSSDGLLAILGHELGHFKHKDIFKNLFFTILFIFILFVLMGCFTQEILKGLGLDGNSGSIFAFIVLLSPIFSFWMMPFIGYFSRKAEYNADNFSANLFSKSTLANALVRIVNENKAFPYSHPLYVFFYYTHPPLLDRLKALEYQF
ncbi:MULTISPECIES: M48 family metallopeptidase [unclassified Helicobacter]|uniref:M48 family metallopeptidase n=1 Tax=unclassified Helicobacter TaxID=2593540 RepID=UPI000CF068E1|nr:MULTISPECIES: M48 family metallopeptidase [unclassified Helicobacter]